MNVWYSYYAYINVYSFIIYSSIHKHLLKKYGRNPDFVHLKRIFRKRSKGHNHPLSLFSLPPLTLETLPKIHHSETKTHFESILLLIFTQMTLIKCQNTIIS